ncbi:GNAT family N-acetyltransferase [Nocardioides sp. Iso805N]|uniref:GNAT family N-acetyltransferase n=1 Tax=Nocardioides sp. Iso805N TaxID=1283287 RepID=UPI0003636EF4|nr:GNAT family N-acetyltransferase [Nocardioides sp. Iso805N]
MTVLRPALPADVAEMATIQVGARMGAPMPVSIHPGADIAAFLAARLDTDEAWVAEVDGEAVAYARFTSTWLDDLYVHPAWQGEGLGGMLLDLVKSLRPGGLGLYVFASNLPAQRFYARRGFVVTDRYDGSANEEREPDLRMEWVGPDRRG